MPAARILQVIPSLDTGGAEKATLEITQALSTAGAASVVVTRGGRMVSAVEWAGGEVIEFPVDTKSPFKIYRNARWLAKLIREKNIDVVHARSRAPAWSALIAARKTKRPFVTTYHGAYSNKGLFKNTYNSVMARGDIVIANSAFTAGLIQQQHKLAEERIRVIHRGVDISEFNPTAIGFDRLEKMRRDWGILPSKFIVLQAARLTGWKGQRIVIEAAAELASRGLMQECEFILAGDSQGRSRYSEELKSLINKYELTDQIKLVGHCDDMPAAYACAHIVVVASTEPEAFGRAAAEAQSLGCQVIVSDLGAVPETVLAKPDVAADQTTGWRIKPGDPMALADALQEALTTPSLERRAMSARARAHIQSNFSLDHMKYKTLLVYDELIGSRLAPVYLKRL